MRWPVAAGVAAAVAVIGVGSWFIFARGGSPFGGRPAPEFSFELRKVAGTGIEGKAAPEQLAGPAEDVRATLDELYVDGFIDPERWEGGEFPTLTEVFAGDAAARARADLDDLSIGSAAERITFVQPEKGRLDVRFLLGEDGNPFAAWAETLFRARGEVEGAPRVDIRHRGRYLLRPIEGRWLIVGYEVEGRLRPERQRATP